MRRHAEDPFVYPVMSCPLCGFRFMFKEPFTPCDTFLCLKCDKESSIPPQVIDEFIDNMEFKEYLNRNAPDQGGAINSPPPVV